MTKKILIFSGSLRKEAYSKQIGKIATRICDELNTQPTYFELNNYELPLLNQDDTEYTLFPEAAKNVKKLINENNAFIILTPEHNGSIPASLKNLIDWASRPESKDEKMCAVYKMKPTLVLSTSVGPFGGIRAANHLKQILLQVGCNIFPQTKSYIHVQNILNNEEKFSDKKDHNQLKDLLKDFIDFVF